jgi:hypothetical protein
VIISKGKNVPIQLNQCLLALKGDNADRGCRYPRITCFSDTPR